MTSTQPTAARYLSAYAAVRQRFDDLLSTADGSELVPACPGWTTYDVLAHLVGLCDDWISDRLDGYATASWTATQLERYSGYTVGDLLQQWSSLATDFAHLDDHPIIGPPARWAFGDAIIHEADVRGALENGRAPHDAVLLSLEGTIARWRGAFDNSNPPTTLILRPPDAPEWNLGPANTDRAIVAVPTAYELFRALAGRRTEAQVRAWPWSADPDPVLKVGLPQPFQWANTPIND